MGDALYQLSTRSVILVKGEETPISCHNSTLVIRSEKGLHFLDFSHNLENIDKNLDFLEFYTSNPTTTPASELFKAPFIRTGMRNLQYTEMLVNPALFGHNAQMLHDLVTVSVMEWSPVDFLHHNLCALAVLTNVGSVEMYGRKRDKWLHILSLSSCCDVILKNPVEPQNFEELKSYAYTLYTSAICWAPVLIGSNSCYLVTAQKNRELLFWHLQSNDGNIEAEIKSRFTSETFEINCIKWILTEEDKFLLICANNLGQIIAYQCSIDNGKIKLIASHTLWHHKDKMIVKYIKHTNIDGNIVLIFAKHRHLCVLMFDQKCNILGQYVKNINDARINSVIDTVNGIYVATINCKIYKMTMKVLDGKLLVNLEPIVFKETFVDKEITTVAFSENNMIYAFAVTDTKVLCRKVPIKVDLMFMTTERNMEEVFSVLLNNPSKKLTNFGDCIELLRIKTYKSGTLPEIDYEKLYSEGDTDVYKLKIYLIILIIFNRMNHIIKVKSDIKLPETSIDNVKEKILFQHVVHRLNNFLVCEDKDGNDFDMKSFNGMKGYLKYYCEKNELNASDFVNDDKLNKFNGCSNSYICMCCDKELEGFSCSDGHLNMFCILSMTLIENTDEYLVCRICGVTARSELFDSKPMCLICDQYLCKR